MDNSGEFWLHAFESLVADLPEPAFVVDADGDITHWNQAVENILGLPASEAVGMNAYDVFGRRQSGRIAQEVNATFAQEKSPEGDVRLRSTSPTRRWHTREQCLSGASVSAGTLSCLRAMIDSQRYVEQRAPHRGPTHSDDTSHVHPERLRRGRVWEQSDDRVTVRAVSNDGGPVRGLRVQCDCRGNCLQCRGSEQPER